MRSASDKSRISAAEVLAALEAGNDIAVSGKARATRVAYRTDWQDFCEWCAYHRRAPLPADPDGIAAYIEELAKAGKKFSTLNRRVAAIAFAHEIAGHYPPTRTIEVQKALYHIHHLSNSVPDRKTPAVTEAIRAMVEGLHESLIEVRDKAVVLVGFAGAFRRSELAALDLEDVEECVDGLKITCRNRQTPDRIVRIPFGEHEATCPVRALRRWVEAAGIVGGPLFRGVNRHGQVLGRLSDRGVARAVKRAALAAGLDPERYAGHSLRAGLATSAAAAGVAERIIMKQTGHKSERTLRRYIRDGSLFRDNAAKEVGL